jgi:hypothetical protein
MHVYDKLAIVFFTVYIYYINLLQLGSF